MTIFKIKINVVFLLNNFLFYMQNIVQSLHRIRCKIYVLISAKTNFIYIYKRVGMIKYWKLMIIFNIFLVTY